MRIRDPVLVESRVFIETLAELARRTGNRSNDRSTLFVRRERSRVQTLGVANEIVFNEEDEFAVHAQTFSYSGATPNADCKQHGFAMTSLYSTDNIDSETREKVIKACLSSASGKSLRERIQKLDSSLTQVTSWYLATGLTEDGADDLRQRFREVGIEAHKTSAFRVPYVGLPFERHRNNVWFRIEAFLFLAVSAVGAGLLISSVDRLSVVLVLLLLAICSVVLFWNKPLGIVPADLSVDSKIFVFCYRAVPTKVRLVFVVVATSLFVVGLLFLNDHSFAAIVALGTVPSFLMMYRHSTKRLVTIIGENDVFFVFDTSKTGFRTFRGRLSVHGDSYIRIDGKRVPALVEPEEAKRLRAISDE